MPHQMAIILDHRTAPRRIDNNPINLTSNPINLTSGDFFMPRINGGAYRGIGLFGLANMVCQCPATMCLFAYNHLDAKPV